MAFKRSGVRFPSAPPLLLIDLTQQFLRIPYITEIRKIGFRVQLMVSDADRLKCKTFDKTETIMFQFYRGIIGIKQIAFARIPTIPL